VVHSSGERHSEEANDRTSWGDRSLPRQVHKGTRSSPARARTNTQVRTFAHPWAIVRPRRRLSPVTYLGHFSPFPHHFYNNVALDCSWLEYQFFFRTCVFGYKFGGMIYPHLLTQVSYTLHLIFQFYTYIGDNV
jgi:hypothetical protein